MKKYFLMIPLMIFPYAYLLWMLSMYFTSETLKIAFGENDAASNVWLGVAVVYVIYVLFIVFYNCTVSARGKYTAYESAKINLFVKGIQVPAYIFHFILGMMGFVMSVWGIGIIMVVVIVDLVTIILTGISSIGCTIRMKKEKVLNGPLSILLGIGCFLYVVDVAVAFVYFFKARKHSKKPEIQAVPAEAIGGILKLRILKTILSVCKVPDYSKVNWDDEYLFIGKTDEENSIVCSVGSVPANALKRDDGWRAFRIQGVLDFSLIGILSRISTILAENGIGIFAVSTFNTDYILTKEINFSRAVEVMKEHGYVVEE